MITKKIIESFFKKMDENLKGDWLVLGGTVLHFLDIYIRTTTDIDLVSLSQKEDNQSTLKLMELAEKLKIPPTSINQAAGFFLFKIKNYRDNLLTLHQGKNITIYCPNLVLYVELKIQRLSETDLGDCLAYIQYAKNKKEVFDRKTIKNLVLKKIQKSTNLDKIQRLKKLLSSIQN